MVQRSPCVRIDTKPLVDVGVTSHHRVASSGSRGTLLPWRPDIHGRQDGLEQLHRAAVAGSSREVVLAGDDDDPDPIRETREHRGTPIDEERVLLFGSGHEQCGPDRRTAADRSRSTGSRPPPVAGGARMRRHPPSLQATRPSWAEPGWVRRRPGSCPRSGSWPGAHRLRPGTASAAQSRPHVPGDASTVSSQSLSHPGDVGVPDSQVGIVGPEGLRVEASVRPPRGLAPSRAPVPGSIPVG